MPKWFNIAGPCKADIHYMLPPTLRLPQIESLIAQQNYFVIHAPRQTGKTTAIMALAQQLTASGRYTAVMVSAEAASAYSAEPAIAEAAFLSALRESAIELPLELQPPAWIETATGQQLGTALRVWAQASPRPLVILIDEIDSLQDVALISVLRQLRAGYPRRPGLFPQSVALVGLRDVRDYKVAAGGSVRGASPQENRLNTASPFNIKVASLTLRNFIHSEVAELYAQHTAETGQIFTESAVQRAFELTQGQPWLVNALARQVVEVLVPDPKVAIAPTHIDQAKEILIQRQDTHLDSLAERLREPRIRAIIEPILSGQELGNLPHDDIQFILDLGLCRLDGSGGLVIANPIYREVLPRVLSFTTTASLPHITPSWLMPDGRLNPDQLLEAFLGFWRQHGEPLLKSAPYHEIAPHLVLMAFLHRVVNGGGTLEREYAIGSDRMDLCLRYGDVTLAMELKVWREGRPDPLKAGLEQLERYLAGLNLSQGWLVIFDRRSGLSPISDRTTTESAVTASGRKVRVIRG